MKKLANAFFRLLWKFLVWLFSGLFWLLKKVFGAVAAFFLWLFSLAKNAVSKAASDAKRPQGAASFSSFSLLEPKSGSLEDFEKTLFSGKSLVGVIVGARGSGKSALGMRILENAAAKGRKVCALGFLPETMPPWIQMADSPDDAPNGSFFLVDEGGIAFSSRNAFSSPNKLLSELLLISRHKDMSVLFISQNSANLDVNALRQADYFLLRKPSLLQKDFERKIIGKIYSDNSPGFEKFENDYPTLVYSDSFLGFAKNGLPSFWTEKASKAFSKAPIGQAR